MSMYTIIKRLDGTYECVGKLQDGTERWSETDLLEAIRRMKQFAAFMNGEKRLKKSGIVFYKEQQVTETKLVRVDSL